MSELITTLRRKVIHRNLPSATPKVSVPRWWIKDAEEVEVEVYIDKIVIKRKEDSP